MRIGGWSSDVCTSDLPGSLKRSSHPASPMRWSRLRRHTFVCLEMIAIVALLSPAHRLNQPLQMAFQKSQADRWRCDREGREGGKGTSEIGRASCRERVCQYV